LKNYRIIAKNAGIHYSEEPFFLRFRTPRLRSISLIEGSEMIDFRHVWKPDESGSTGRKESASELIGKEKHRIT